MIDVAWLTIGVLVVCPVLIHVIARFGDSPVDNGYGFGCCVLWLVLFFGWVAQALYEIGTWAGWAT